MDKLNTLFKGLSLTTKKDAYRECLKKVKTTVIERKQNAEVLTPLKLVEEMMSKIPEDAWNDISGCNFPRIFDPCVGKGAFMVVVYDILWEKLEGIVPEDEREQVILEEMLFFADINPFNIEITKLLLDPRGQYNLNYYTGNSLELDVREQFGFEKFDIIVGNPPYNKSSGTGGSRKLWDKFVGKYIKTINVNGWFSFIHPPNWRKPESRILELVKMYNLVTLNMIDDKKGVEYFSCSTKADFYTIQNTKYKGKTVINDKIELDIKNLKFIPNSNFKTFLKLYGRNNIVCPNTSFSSDNKWMKTDKNLKYKYLVTKNKNESKFKYSDEKKQYIGIKKVIISLGRYPYPVNDYKGEYGLSCYNFGIVINDKNEGENICRAINTQRFMCLLKNNKWGSYNIDWRMFKYFKKDFWKEFI
jgi:hypothetical protein